ncbi:MAG TPA: Na+/H+ antiporter subunit E [Bdellovibrionota bacterium]|nr:Na+/H+ antiporter subunit E [Bdellovibrionota bacterium]
MRLLWNIVLAVFWASLWGELSLKFLLSGFVLAYFVLMMLERSGVIVNKFYGRKVWRAVGFFFYFVKELWTSSILVAIDVLRARPKARPAIVKVPLDLRDDAQIALFANVISLTPGTLTLDVSPDKQHIYIHAMFFDPSKREDFVAEIKNGFERRIRELFES